MSGSCAVTASDVSKIRDYQITNLEHLSNYDV